MKEKEQESRKKQIVVKVFVYAFLVFTGIMVLIPFYWMVLTSLKSFDLIYSETQPSLWIPFSEMVFQNYMNALDAAPYLKYSLSESLCLSNLLANCSEAVLILVIEAVH